MRACGILMHITSLPSPYGIGSMGKATEKFIDWLKSAGQHFWQVLPIGPTGYGDSPYQSFSTFAGNPLLIDLDDLVESGLISKGRYYGMDFGEDPLTVDFEKVSRMKMMILNEAFASFQEDVGYLAFIQEEASWLEDYALFMALKEKYNNVSWIKWERELCFREKATMDKYRMELTERIKFWRFVQYTFHCQWQKLKRYANKNDVLIIGDIPIYVAMDSADVWANHDLFLLDSELSPTKVAGVPPDYFSATGQLWGNPIYNWDVMKKENYCWWISRIQKAQSLYDVVRIDHFRAFDTYYTIPFGMPTAEHGKWEFGPGMDLFNEIKKQIGDVKIIAEDLGDIFDSVVQLLEETGFPGMRVLQFGFNSNNEDNIHLPHQYKTNCVAYTGTHDNETSMGWYKSANSKAQQMAKGYLNFNLLEKKKWAFIRAVYQSPADVAIVPMQDVLGLGSKARMNIPSTLGGNWNWRMKNGANTPLLGRKLKDLAQGYLRYSE